MDNQLYQLTFIAPTWVLEHETYSNAPITCLKRVWEYCGYRGRGFTLEEAEEVIVFLREACDVIAQPKPWTDPAPVSDCVQPLVFISDDTKATVHEDPFDNPDLVVFAQDPLPYEIVCSTSTGTLLSDAKKDELATCFCELLSRLNLEASRESVEKALLSMHGQTST